MQEMTDLVELGLFIGINGCSLKTEENIEVVRAIPEDKLMLETDAPWCEIRSTHASFKYWKNVDESIQKLYAPPSKKKEKFERGFMVKSRNEPCAMG
jgi:TatD DNase family protein